mmetsp:Transcript_88290/g.189574  ORF Transcript_88290/g.189574 Transcript_88290/m.189574 type:complete len:283 (+) Transcript_88290:1177-2025(+)
MQGRGGYGGGICRGGAGGGRCRPGAADPEASVEGRRARLLHHAAGPCGGIQEARSRIRCCEFGVLCGRQRRHQSICRPRRLRIAWGPAADPCPWCGVASSRVASAGAKDASRVSIPQSVDEENALAWGCGDATISWSAAFATHLSTRARCRALCWGGSFILPRRSFHKAGGNAPVSIYSMLAEVAGKPVVLVAAALAVGWPWGGFKCVWQPIGHSGALGGGKSQGGQLCSATRRRRSRRCHSWDRCTGYSVGRGGGTGYKRRSDVGGAHQRTGGRDVGGARG